jgi:hypothetical protein
VPATCRSLAAARLRADCPSGNAPTTRVRRPGVRVADEVTAVNVRLHRKSLSFTVSGVSCRFGRNVRYDPGWVTIAPVGCVNATCEFERSTWLRVGRLHGLRRNSSSSESRRRCGGRSGVARPAASRRNRTRDKAGRRSSGILFAALRRRAKHGPKPARVGGKRDHLLKHVESQLTTTWIYLS